jgi:fucose permease
MLTFGAVLQIIAQTLRTWFPPLPLYAITFCIASLGQALNDTHANVFVSSLERSHRYLGFIHAMYMAGCLIGPLVATAVASSVKTKGQWSLFYLFPLGIGVINLTLIAIFFRDRFCLKFKLEPNSEARSTQKTGLTEIKATLSTPAVWLLSLFFFFFLGAAITAGGICSIDTYSLLLSERRRRRANLSC